VPGLTDHFDEIEQLAAFAKELGNVERVDVLPFHKLGEYKWKECGQPYKLENTEPPSREMTDRARAVFRDAGLNIA
jgi:pyruvate formate lyase activating enzyme